MVVEKFDKDSKKKNQTFNNLYVKEFPTTWKSEDLQTHFEKYGTLVSVKVMTNEAGETSGFGFVCFEKPEDAQKAINAEHNSKIGDKTLYVARAEKKETRLKDLAKCNIYVKNFDQSVTDEVLKNFFEGYGKVKNVKVFVTETSEGQTVNKGFGFVCFEEPEIASKVIQLSKSNNLMLNGMVLFASFFQTKEERKKAIIEETKQNKESKQMNQMASAISLNMKTLMDQFTQKFNPMMMQGMGGFRPGNFHGGRGGFGGNNFRGNNQGFRGGYNGGAQRPQARAPPARGGAPPMQTPPVQRGAPPMMQAPTQTSDASKYNTEISTLLKSPHYTDATDAEKREKVGESIYTYIAKSAGETNAPKITGMIIDLPIVSLEECVATWATLDEKIKEGKVLLETEQKQ